MTLGLDTRAIVRVYAWLATTIGAAIVASGVRGGVPEPHLPAITFGRASLVWIGGAVIVAAGLSAFGLTSIETPRARRKAVGWFAAGHILVGLLVLSQWSLFWRDLFTPLAALAPLVIGGLLLAWTLASPDDADVLDVSRLRTRYAAQLREAARLEERSRLARDLHDAVKQQLFAIQTAATTAEVRFDNDPPGAREALSHIRTSAREATAEMAALIDELQATPLENVGLTEALRKQCEALRFRTGADVTLDIGTLPPSEVMVPGTHDALCRVAQEAMANVARHARARHVEVSLTRQGSRVLLRVSDDGQGIAVTSPGPGMGQRNMQARAADVGGNLRITSTPGSGTEVAVDVPIAFHHTVDRWRDAAVAASLLLFALVMGLLQGEWTWNVMLWTAEVWLVISVWRVLRKARAA